MAFEDTCFDSHIFTTANTILSNFYGENWWLTLLTLRASLLVTPKQVQETCIEVIVAQTNQSVTVIYNCSTPSQHGHVIRKSVC